MSETPTTPQGDPIETHTMWLDFGEDGECAVSADLTAFMAAMRRSTRERPVLGHRHGPERKVYWDLGDGRVIVDRRQR